MKLARTIVLLAGLIAGLSACGQDAADITVERTLVAVITSNYDAKVTELWMAVDDTGNAVSLDRVEQASRRTKSFAIADLSKGVVLMEEGGHDIFTLRSSDFDPIRGGHLELNYLHNGLSGSRRSVGLEADSGADGWRLLHAGTAFKKMHVIANKILGKVVGVKELRFSVKAKLF